MRLTVLEYSTGKVYSYNWTFGGSEKFDAEEYLEEMGFNLDDCHYMVHRSPIMIY